MELSEISSRVLREAPNCPGGVGNFGFNSYDLLTFGLMVMGAVSSAVIVNTNKNENNDNNNDLQTSLGQLTTNVQMASADQTSTNGAMITVPPTGTPIVVPVGRFFPDGRVELLPGVQIPGVSWMTDELQVFDDGVIIEMGLNGTSTSDRRTRGLVAFGTIDEQNVFHLLPLFKGKLLDWNTVRKASGQRVGKSENPPIIPFDGAIVFVPSKEIDGVYKKAVETHGLTLVQIAAPPIGPPILIPIGALLSDGNVLLNDGIETEGIRWESEDRILYPNGTIAYKLTGKIEEGKIAYGTVDNQGRIQLLPKLGNHKTSLSLFNDLNVKPTSRSIRTSMNRLAENELFRVRDRMRRMKRDVNRFKYVQNLIKATLSTASLLHEMDLHNADYWTHKILCETYNLIDPTIMSSIIEQKNPSYACFVSKILTYCNDMP